MKPLLSLLIMLAVCASVIFAAAHIEPSVPSAGEGDPFNAVWDNALGNSAGTCARPVSEANES